MNQYQHGFVINEIIISDDSDDSTPEKINQFIQTRGINNIKLFHHNNRRGAGAAWNEIFENASGEITILYDADVFPDKNCTYNLVKSFDNEIGLIASNQEPLFSDTVFYRASRFISNWLRLVRQKSISQYTLMGRGFAIKTNIAKKIKIPEDIIAIDLYIQCRCMDNNVKIFYQDKAHIKFNPPNNLRDFASQILRASNGHKQLSRCVLESKKNLSRYTLLMISISNFFSHPLDGFAFVYCILQIPFNLSKFNSTSFSAKWEIAQSTKI